MKESNAQKWINKIRAPYKSDEETLYSIKVGASFTLITLLCASSVFLFQYLQLKTNLMIYSFNNYPRNLEWQETYWVYVFKQSNGVLLGLVIGLAFVFCIGFYLSKVMIRPFKLISKHCEQKILDKKINYKPDLLSNLKLLSKFSVYFFSKIDELKENEKLKITDIPKEFTGIHKPRFEWSFFINYSFILVILLLISSYSLIYLNSELRDLNAELSYKFFKDFKNIDYFQVKQSEIFDVSFLYFLSIHIAGYIFLGFFLYGKVAVPAFAVFATFRSFLKGNYHNRIHLIGYYYLRDECRIINKYLEEIQKRML